MKPILLTASLLAPALLGQAPQKAPQKAQQKSLPGAAEEAAAGAAKWIRQLGSDSYRDRLEAENQLRKLGEQARGALEAAAAGSADSEVQWRAKRLLRQFGDAAEARTGGAPRGGLVERTPDRSGDARGPDVVEQGRVAPRRADDMRAEFDRIFKRFEDMGLDVPRRSFFDQPFFRDLESQLGRGADRASSSQSMNVQVGPGGVRVEVVEQGEDGEPETKVYEAPDMETFQKNHPGVLKGNGLRLGLGGVGLDGLGLGDVDLGEMGFGGLDKQLQQLRGRIGRLERGFDWQLAEPRWIPLPQPGDAEVVPASPAPPQGRRLGVTVKPVPDAVRAYLALGEGGLMVDGVQDDGLADACGLQPDDIVTKIGGRAIASPADVAAALGGIQKGAEVRVEFVRRGRPQVATTAKRHDAPAGRAPLPRKVDASGAQQKLPKKLEERR